MLTEGITNTLALQAETTFNAASAETIYFVAGKTGFSFEPMHSRGSVRKNVWRQDQKQTSSVLFYRGSLSVELGVNTITRLLLAAFFELKAATALGGGITKYEYRPRRAGNFGSLKFGLENNPGGPYLALHGVVIDQLEISVNRRSLVTMTVGFKFVRREDDVQMSATATALDASTLDHVHSRFEIDAAAQSYFQEFSMRASDPKMPARFGENKLATRFRGDGKQSMSGGGVEIGNSESVITDKVNALAEGSVSAKLEDRTNTNRYILFTLPRCSFTSGTPTGIARDDVASRFSFDVLQDSELDTSDEVLITLCV